MSKVRILLLSAGILISCSAFADKIDTIYFQNGDRVTAEVKRLLNNQLRLSTDDAGTIYVEWDDIDSVKILNKMRIVLEEGTILNGQLFPAGESGKCYIRRTDEEPLLLELLQIVELTPLERKFMDRLGGGLGSGFSYVKANEILQMNFDASITYTVEKNQLELDYSGLFSKDYRNGYSQNQAGGVTLLHLLPKNWFFISFLRAEINSEMDLDLRTSLTLGAGNSFIRNSRAHLYSALGLQANREVSLGTPRFNLAGVLTSKYSVFIFEDPEVSFFLEWDLYPSLNHPGRLRTNIYSNLKWEVFGDFYLKWSFFFNWDNRPFSDEAEKSDWAVTLLGVEYQL